MDISLYSHLEDKLYKKRAQDLNGITRPGLLSINETHEEFSSKVGLTASKFININGKRYFVKYPTLGANHANHEIFAELLTSFIAKKVGVDCVDQRLLIDNSQRAIGVISPDFGEHFMCAKVILYDGQSTTVNAVIDRMSAKLQFKGIKIEREKLIEKLNKICCFDYLIFQKDRHSQNLAFVIREENGEKVLDVAPIYDNANAFLGYIDRFYKLNPNDCEIYGLEQQKLLNTTYKDMLTKFQELFGDKFEETMQEFKEYYGLDKLFAEYEFDTWQERTLQNVRNKISQCRLRREGAKCIPLEVVYAVFLRHKNEIPDEEFTKRTDNLALALSSYYSNEQYEDSYKNYIKGTNGELPTWECYGECEELSKSPNSQEIIFAKKLLEEKQRKYEYNVLNLATQRRYFSDSLYDKIEYILKEKEDVFTIEKEDRFFAKLNSLYRFRNYFPYYKHLREWCEELERKASLTEQEKQEYEKVKRILSKFIKRFNAIARRNNDEHKKEILEHAGLRFDKKLGIVGVENEDKSLL